MNIKKLKQKIEKEKSISLDYVQKARKMNDKEFEWSSSGEIIAFGIVLGMIEELK